jgi:hypothetical protein
MQEEIKKSNFSILLEAALMPVKEKFYQLHHHMETWGFLYNTSE